MGFFAQILRDSGVRCLPREIQLAHCPLDEYRGRVLVITSVLCNTLSFYEANVADVKAREPQSTLILILSHICFRGEDDNPTSIPPLISVCVVSISFPSQRQTTYHQHLSWDKPTR